ncbi:MAG: tRNA (adenosine(37)-N6)-threonylcarbamoyltransferase complex dimerization subunit type 1 TsaB [Paracoccaceae bacterium]|nr:tRNA (adenosine(37)-N6)-threonylcarbamoyltransferase complex dimerization subunit type 1 TsaB [Paracoccaceae bacterium]
MPPKTDPNLPLILGFDTSAAHCAAALLSGTQLLGQKYEPMQKGQAEYLMPMLEALLARHGYSFSNLAGIGVGIGPGNFTGVRISVAAARGLSLGLSVPAIGITSLEATAFGAPRPCTVALDARREMAYVQRFESTPHLPEIMAIQEIPTDFPLWGSVPTSQTPPFNIAVAIAQLAAERLPEVGLPPHAQRPSPFYMRSADAAPSSDLPPKIIERIA